MMNFEEFRRTGEFSDITVIVDKTEFKLHTFPLFTKSDYFKKAFASSSPPYVIQLDQQFPGGANVFNQLADYFYSIPITIDHTNIVPLRAAACFIECEALSSLSDKRLDEILILAQVKYDLSVPLALLEQCKGEYQHWATKANIVEKCLRCIMELFVRGASLQLNKSDQESLVRLPLEWLIQWIKLYPKESKHSILPFVKHYVTTRALHEEENQTKNDGNDEKRAIIDEIVKTLGETIEDYPLGWLNSVYEKAVELKCECEPILSAHITQAILKSTKLHDGIETIPDDVMSRLVERVNKHKEDHVKDPQLLAKLSTLLDSYVAHLRQRGTLTSEQFVKVASCIPKEQRNSHDSLLLALDEILKNEKSTQLSSHEREELLSQVDFSRVNEETIAACKSNQLIPQQLITDAALALCTKLRKQLDDTQTRLQLVELQMGKTRPASTTPICPKHRSSNLNSSFRLPPRSRSTLSNTYEIPRQRRCWGRFERYRECASTCPDTCQDVFWPNVPKLCPMMCRIGCECIPPFVRLNQHANSPCVHPRHCRFV
ncbi:unnamed protein product [Adineta ricciae]|nr:unnamed protein product [Adineta ricciae]